MTKQAAEVGDIGGFTTAGTGAVILEIRSTEVESLSSLIKSEVLSLVGDVVLQEDPLLVLWALAVLNVGHDEGTLLLGDWASLNTDGTASTIEWRSL